MLGKDAEMRKQINQIVRDYAQSHGGFYYSARNGTYCGQDKSHHTCVNARAPEIAGATADADFADSVFGNIRPVWAGEKNG